MNGADLPAHDVFERARASIVSIRAGAGTGTGFCATPSGVIVTNAHVVGYAREVQVRAHGRAEVAATVFLIDMRLDVAFVSMPDPPPCLPLGESGAVRVGERVLAIGDPLGLPASATSGIVSATGRKAARHVDVTYLQTDAALNPGNSGGPMLDARGRVVGVNTLVHASADGIGFAVPIDALRPLLAPFAQAVPAPLPELTYACRSCARPHVPQDRWCAGCGVVLGFDVEGELDVFHAGLIAASLLEALGFDPATCRADDGVWRLEANGAEVWVDVIGAGRAFAFSARLGMLPSSDPLPVLRFLTAANDRSVGPCRLVLHDHDIIVAEVIEPVAFVSPSELATTLGQLLALAAEVAPLLQQEFRVAPPLQRFASEG